jgi:Helix-turn-helix domain
MSQCTEILNYLKAGRTLTHLSAYNLFDCNRLAARAYELKRRGHKIKTETIATSRGKRIAVYYLKGPKQARVGG